MWIIQLMTYDMGAICLLTLGSGLPNRETYFRKRGFPCALFPDAQLEDKTDKLYEVFMENRKPPIWVSSDHVLAVAFAVRLNGKKGVQ